MDREERIRQLASDMEMFGDYVLEWGGEHFDYDKTASALDKLGYRKIVWHKVADGDYPEIGKYVLCFTEYKGIHMWRLCTVGDAHYWADIEEHYYNSERVIAWTKLPTYIE